MRLSWNQGPGRPPQSSKITSLTSSSGEGQPSPLAHTPAVQQQGDPAAFSWMQLPTCPPRLPQEAPHVGKGWSNYDGTDSPPPQPPATTRETHSTTPAAPAATVAGQGEATATPFLVPEQGKAQGQARGVTGFLFPQLDDTAALTEEFDAQLEEDRSLFALVFQTQQNALGGDLENPVEVVVAQTAPEVTTAALPANPFGNPPDDVPGYSSPQGNAAQNEAEPPH